MAKDVKQYCQSCVTCASSRPAPSHRGTRLTLSSQPQEPWQEIAMDIKRPFGTKPTANEPIVMFWLSSIYLLERQKLYPFLTSPRKRIVFGRRIMSTAKQTLMGLLRLWNRKERKEFLNDHLQLTS